MSSYKLIEEVQRLRTYPTEQELSLLNDVIELINDMRDDELSTLLDEVPDLGDEPDQDKYPCEWVLWSDRKRIRSAIDNMRGEK